MTSGKNCTLAFQINEELFQRIKTHLERESARLGGQLLHHPGDGQPDDQEPPHLEAVLK